MMKEKYLIFLLPALMFFSFYNAAAQFSMADENSGKFYFDAYCFKGSADSLARVDVYALIPYESLRFEKKGNLFGANYEITIRVDDRSGNKVKEEMEVRKLTETDYFTAMGGNGNFDYHQTVMELPPGSYKITADINDSHSGKIFRRSRNLTVINFTKYPFAMSSIMLVNSIEGIEGNFKITPHLSDDIGSLTDGFFLFFEVYNTDMLEQADFAYKIFDGKGDLFFQSEKFRKKLDAEKSQQYIKVSLNDKFDQGNYKITLFALRPNDDEEIKESDYLAITERSLKFNPMIAGKVLKDIDLAIRQLTYVAEKDELEFIQAATTAEEKHKRFKDFWKMKDPSPQTDKNEAFETYYGRIEYADKKFKSYTAGWRSDMGMVFIIYGSPYNIERYNSTTDTRQFERWTYGNNKQFTFVDNSGFGNDFRLYSPMSVADKFEYGN